jgi:hypothetical protein
MGKVKYPFGAADRLTPVPVAGAVELTIDNQLTFVSLSGLTEETEISLNPSADLEPGATVIIDVQQGIETDEQDVVFGDDIVAPALTGVFDDRDKITLTWNGVEWLGGVWEKIVNAV